MRAEIEREIVRLNLEGSVSLLGAKPWEDILQHAVESSFYLQTSMYEGMALSVVEAMQAGLVPIVKPVGEISSYTRDGESAIWLGDGPGALEEGATKVVDLISNASKWRAMRAAAVNVWKDQPLYADDVLAAANEVLRQ
jgi:glycosyltransferase involved in cell wall biosynthesis